MFEDIEMSLNLAISGMELTMKMFSVGNLTLELALENLPENQDMADEVICSTREFVAKNHQVLLEGQIEELRAKVKTLNVAVENWSRKVLDGIGERDSNIPEPVRENHNRAIEIKLDSVGKRTEPEL